MTARKTKDISAVVAREHVVQAYGLAKTIVRCAAWVSGGYIAKEMIIALAGRETLVSVNLAFLGDIKFSVAVTAAITGLGWGALERWLRHRKVEHLQGRIKELETVIDPNRTSSHLTKQGKTNPGDRLP